jgi:hypothetical protein
MRVFAAVLLVGALVLTAVGAQAATLGGLKKELTALGYEIKEPEPNLIVAKKGSTTALIRFDSRCALVQVSWSQLTREVAEQGARKINEDLLWLKSYVQEDGSLLLERAERTGKRSDKELAETIDLAIDEVADAFGIVGIFYSRSQRAI